MQELKTELRSSFSLVPLSLYFVVVVSQACPHGGSTSTSLYPHRPFQGINEDLWLAATAGVFITAEIVKYFTTGAEVMISRRAPLQQEEALESVSSWDVSDASITPLSIFPGLLTSPEVQRSDTSAPSLQQKKNKKTLLVSHCFLFSTSAILDRFTGLSIFCHF